MAIVISGVNNNDRITASDGTIDLLSGVNYIGIVTAPSITAPGNITAGHLNIGSGIQLGNAGVATATTFVGNLTGNVNATSNLLLQIGGSEKFRVGSSGQLGIAGANYGTSGQVLTSGGSGSAATWSTISGTTINNNANNRVITGSATANTLDAESTLTYDGADLNISNNTPQIILTDTNSNNSYARVRGNGGNLILSADHTNATGGTRIINFEIGGSEKARITSDGRLGIGTENPQRPLAVTSGTSGVTAEFNIPDNNPTGSGAGLSLNIVNRSNSGWAPLSFNSQFTTFGNAGVEKARLDNNGNWCVGITGGSAKLHTKGEQSGGLIKCDAAEGTSRFFVTGNDSNACEVNLYDGAGAQKGILKAESDGMSMKGGGTPSQLQFFTTVTGGSSTRRFLIDDYGASQIERGSNGWSTLYHKTNNGGTRYHYRQANAGASGVTVNLMRIRRHYWGSGNYKISTRQTYYNGSFESHHYISGHAANGNTTSFNINYQNQNGGNSSQIQKTATSHSSPGNNYAGWIDVYISIGAYEYYDIIIEASAMAQYSQDINNLGNDAYALHPF